MLCINSFPTSGDLYHLPITFANSLDPDKAGQNVKTYFLGKKKKISKCCLLKLLSSSSKG